jgi:ribosomal 50S subunit-associated protein YjgA (DUF615 family)
MTSITRRLFLTIFSKTILKLQELLENARATQVRETPTKTTHQVFRQIKKITFCQAQSI